MSTPPIRACSSHTGVGRVRRASARTLLSDLAPVEPDHSTDPVAAVLAAHADGRLVALPTAGSTGAPRRIVRTTASWWQSFDAYSALTGVGPGARVWVPGPLTATMNLFAGVHAAAVGAATPTSPTHATHACLTPAQLDRHGADLLPGTGVVVAGAALTPALRARAVAHGLRVAHYYGAAELSFVAAAAHGEPLSPFPGVEVDVREGELWVRSPYLCRGYAGAPGTLRRDAHGWATVGDLGRYDEGVVTVLGRPGHAVTGGATVALAEVETALATQADGAVAVCALPHEILGSVLACAVTESGDLPLLQRYSRAQLPPSHRPRHWRVLAELPLTTAGKTDRAALADCWADAHA